MKRAVIFLVVLMQLLCLFGCGKQDVLPYEASTHPEMTATAETAAATSKVEEAVPENTEPTDPAPKEEPAVPTAWKVACNTYISMYAYPDGYTTDSIYNGEKVELLGWNERYAKISYNGAVGYVLAGYLMPENESYIYRCLETVKPTHLYTYWDMVADIDKLKKQYPGTVTASSIGTTELGRDIPVLRIGNIDAEHHVLLQGAIHGREHLTAWLMMAMADYWLAHGILSYGDICYHIIPMVNPDGVIISQTQKLNDEQREIYLSDKKRGYTLKTEAGYAADWKANGKGVDLNRSFPSGWEPIDDRGGPSSERYKGVKPFSALEAVALKDYTYQYPFDVTVSYHSSGSIIYYEYGRKEPVNSQSKSLGKAVNQVTGYRMANSVGVGGAGYKDWVMEELGIPSLTVEIGSGDSPLEARESYSTFVRNIGVLPAIAGWLIS